jgi:hypothetical protein
MMLRVADKAKKKIESNRIGALVIAVVAIGILLLLLLLPPPLLLFQQQ